MSTTREEAGHVQGAVADAAGDVLGTAKEEASAVATDVQHETRRLIGETRDQLGRQATDQRDQAVQGLRSLGDELRGMAEHGSGWGAQLARHGAGWTDRTAGFLDGRDLGDILNDVRSMARRRPGRFLLGAAVAGVVVGRMSRAMAAGAPDRSASNGQVTSGQAGVRRTGQDELHRPLASGEPGPVSDPTLAGTAPPGQPTVEPGPPPVAGTAVPGAPAPGTPVPPPASGTPSPRPGEW